MKKALTIILMVAIIFTAMTVSYAENDKVEISFCVGDSTLIINGESVSVEKPYIVGDGVTLVPIRVITEAFGATLDWENTTKTVTLQYKGTEIILQIGNPVAKINGEEKELLSPPELTQNGFTMVPIRFISENFGAEVEYNTETKRVTVSVDNKKDSDTLWTCEDIKGGYMRYSSDELGISFEVPELFIHQMGDNNEIILKSGGFDASHITINIYSKSSVSGSGFLARQIMKENKTRYNMAVVSTDTNPSVVSYKNFNGSEYSGQLKASHLKGYFKNVFFENGDFVYNIGIFLDDVSKLDKTAVTSVLNSVVITDAKLSAEKFDRKEKIAPEPFTISELSSCEFALPGDFAVTDKEGIKIESKDEIRSDKKLIYTDGNIIFVARRIKFDFSDVEKPSRGFYPDKYISFEDVKKMFSTRFGANDAEVMESGSTVKFGDNKFVFLKLYEDGEYDEYHDIYATELNDAIYLFYATYPEIHYSIDNRDVVSSIMRSIVLDVPKEK